MGADGRHEHDRAWSVAPDPVGPGQESVWTYPRPAVAEPTPCRLCIEHRGLVVAETARGVRTLETSHPPTYYFPREDVAPGALRAVGGSSRCEWKGTAVYFDVLVGGEEVLARAAWTYPAPTPAFAILRDRVAFYASPFTACWVDGDRVTPQPGGFYGGWITSRETGPFKGVPGSRFW